MIVDALPTSTTERLLMVADIIEAQPQRYRQDNWWSDGAFGLPLPDPSTVYGRALADDCNTYACIAGWAVALTPRPKRVTSWQEAGARALGLAAALANFLFSAHFEAPAAMVADMLRRMADVPEGERTLANMPAVLTTEQFQHLISNDCVCAGRRDPDEYDEDDEDDDVVEFPPIEPGPDEGAPEEPPEGPSYGNGAHPVDAPVVLVPA